MIKTRVIDDIIVAQIKGRIDMHTQPKYADELRKLVDHNLQSHFVFDFSNVEYISSSGLTMLISFKTKLAKNDRHLKLAAPSPAVQKLFEVVGMSDNFDIYDSENAALDTL